MTDPTPQDVRAAGPDADESAEPAAADSGLDEKQGLLDRFRGTGVGVEDPHIVGDTGPTGVPPGADPETEPPDA